VPIDDLDALLGNWSKLNEVLMQLSEDDVVKLFEHERKTRGRLRTMLRIYNRLSKLRGQREKREFAQDAKA